MDDAQSLLSLPLLFCVSQSKVLVASEDFSMVTITSVYEGFYMVSSTTVFT